MTAYFNPPWRAWPMWLSAAGWVGFSSYWSAAARNSAEAKSSESSKSRLVHEILMNGGILMLFIAVPGLRQNLVRSVPAGLIVQASGVGLAVWARRHLGRNWSMKVQIKVDHELIRTGPYRILRHPIYTAMLMMCCGTALIDGHTHALIGVVIVVVAYWRKVRMEEAKLREAFGPRYDEYRRATLGALPGFF